MILKNDIVSFFSYIKKMCIINYVYLKVKHTLSGYKNLGRRN